ncbi:MAG: hypothetical protein ACK4OM_07015 [Alphaproteobacteria bacterium]
MNEEELSDQEEFKILLNSLYDIDVEISNKLNDLLQEQEEQYFSKLLNLNENIELLSIRSDLEFKDPKSYQILKRILQTNKSITNLTLYSSIAANILKEILPNSEIDHNINTITIYVDKDFQPDHKYFYRLVSDFIALSKNTSSLKIISSVMQIVIDHVSLQNLLDSLKLNSSITSLKFELFQKKLEEKVLDTLSSFISQNTSIKSLTLPNFQDITNNLISAIN